MNKVTLMLLLLGLSIASGYGQRKRAHSPRKEETKEIKIPMEPKYWKFDTARTEFLTYKNTKAVKGKNGQGYQIFLKDYNFENGSIEFDVELSGAGFPGINFRMSSDDKNGENFYIRSFGPVQTEIRTTLQYAALIDGMSIWDLTDEYQSGAVIFQEKWNHVKLVVSGRQMRAYVNDMGKPALVVPELEGRRDYGSISLTGNVIYANLIIKPGATEGLSPEAGYNSTANDTRYLRNWLVSAPHDFPFGKEVILPLPSMYGTLRATEVPTAPLIGLKYMQRAAALLISVECMVIKRRTPEDLPG